MYLCGTVKARYVVATEKCIGLRAEDFVKLTYGMLRRLDLNAQTPIYLGKIATEKESVYAHCFLDNDAVSAIRDLLENNVGRKDNTKVWTSRPDLLSKLIRRLAKKAHVNYQGRRLVFHCLRKFCFDNLCRATSEIKAKQIIGKSTGENAYLNPENLREEYVKALPYLALNGNGTKQKVNELGEENKALKARIRELEAQLAQNQNSISEMTNNFRDLNERLSYYETHGKRKPAFDKFR
jgi:uncharacterized coiled-coil protein SlyX